MEFVAIPLWKEFVKKSKIWLKTIDFDAILTKMDEFFPIFRLHKGFELSLTIGNEPGLEYATPPVVAGL